MHFIIRFRNSTKLSSVISHLPWHWWRIFMKYRQQLVTENTIMDKFCWPLHKKTIASNLPGLISHVQGLVMINFTDLGISLRTISPHQHLKVIRFTFFFFLEIMAKEGHKAIWRSMIRRLCGYFQQGALWCVVGDGRKCESGYLKMSPVDDESCFLGWRREGEWQAGKNNPEKWGQAASMPWNRREKKKKKGIGYCSSGLAGQ